MKPDQSSMARQHWLEEATGALRPLFADKGHDVPDTLRVSLGFPFGSRKAIGQCWSAQASSDTHSEVFVSPVLDDGGQIVATLAHEMVHASVGLEAKHGPVFKRCAVSIGLTGKMTATVAGPALQDWTASLLNRIGPYPCGRLSPADLGRKKQTTRMLKVACASCGYTARVSGKWLEGSGAPFCPDDHGQMEVV